MTILLLNLVPGATGDAWPPPAEGWTHGLIAVVVVLALVAGCAWLLRRGSLGTLGRRRQRVVTAETVALLGDRRSLVVVTVEGRRLLLGLTAASVSLVAELQASAPFDRALDATLGQPGGTTT
ncbi:MAG TPA: flagellar biosynthetic protein FliO [Vicinamibacterales bacterium]|nr:flagellar biosynthetic protein FliO [Vicinamibacterales bacterium]